MVVKDIFPFATVTDCCKGASLMGFPHYIFENELTFENMYLPINLAKKRQFNFSFFKVDSQIHKFGSEDLYYRCDEIPSSPLVGISGSVKV